MLRFFGNLIWMVTGGLMTALFWAVFGLLFYVTIIGIPLGRVAFKMAKLTLAPFGKTIEYGGGGAPSLIANIVWIILAGFCMALLYFSLALLLCATIIGIPAGIQIFKMAKLSLMPFGARVLDL